MTEGQRDRLISRLAQSLRTAAQARRMRAYAGSWYRADADALRQHWPRRPRVTARDLDNVRVLFNGREIPAQVDGSFVRIRPVVGAGHDAGPRTGSVRVTLLQNSGRIDDDTDSRWAGVLRDADGLLHMVSRWERRDTGEPRLFGASDPAGAPIVAGSQEIAITCAGYNPPNEGDRVSAELRRPGGTMRFELVVTRVESATAYDAIGGALDGFCVTGMAVRVMSHDGHPPAWTGSPAP